MGAVFSYSTLYFSTCRVSGLFQSLMGAVFSYSSGFGALTEGVYGFQSLMGAVFSYSVCSSVPMSV